ncbi:hypothetical protein V8F33_004357 [Rhypophila sp. PSN 637]
MSQLLKSRAKRKLGYEVGVKDHQHHGLGVYDNANPNHRHSPSQLDFPESLSPFSYKSYKKFLITRITVSPGIDKQVQLVSILSQWPGFSYLPIFHWHNFSNITIIFLTNIRPIYSQCQTRSSQRKTRPITPGSKANGSSTPEHATAPRQTSKFQSYATCKSTASRTHPTLPQNYPSKIQLRTSCSLKTVVLAPATHQPCID